MCVLQYEDHCLEVALYLLRTLTVDECRSAATVARGIISQVNSRDSGGVLAEGRPGAYSGGMHPCRWNGSPAILQRYHRTRTTVR